MKRILLLLFFSAIIASGYSQAAEKLGYGPVVFADNDSIHLIVTSDTTSAYAYEHHYMKFPVESTTWSLHAAWFDVTDTMYIILRFGNADEMYVPYDTIPVVTQTGKALLYGDYLPFMYGNIIVQTDTSNTGNYDIIWTLKKQ